MDDDLRRLADAVLYEGYVLWPYRRTALKNQRRWTFGGVHPPAHTATHPDDRDALRCETLLVGDGEVSAVVRFLHVVARDVRHAGAPVDALDVDGRRYVAWDEATEREQSVGPVRAGAEAEAAIRIPAGDQEELLAHEDGRPAGTIVHRWELLRGRATLGVERLAPALARVRLDVVNTTPFDGGDRDAAMRRAFCSTHAILRAGAGARFASLADPPAALAGHARGCVNDGLWPILAGVPGDDATVLASPIILEDHPRIAPESPGDLFDSGEIDQLLALSILAMTDEEKADMRDADPRTRAILERTEALTPDELLALHGRLRDPRALA